MIEVSGHADESGRSSQAAQSERRRPGRPKRVHPDLVPLLRKDSLIRGGLAQRDADDLGPAKGVAVSVLLGVALWLGILALAWQIFAR